MIIKPRITDEALDQRLSGLVDRELAERLVAANPELYTHLKERGDILPAFVVAPAREHAATAPLIAHRANRPWYLLLAVGLIAIVGLFVVALLARERLGSGYLMVPGATKPGPVVDTRLATKHRAASHRGAALVPAAALARARASAAIEAAAAARAQQEATAARAALAAERAIAGTQAHPKQPQAQPKSSASVARAPLTQPHPSTRLRISEQTKAQPAPNEEATSDVPVWASAGSSVQASTSGSDAGTGGTTPGDPKYPGRQTPNGPVWGETPPGGGGHAGDVVLGGGGGVVIGGGNCSPSRGGLMLHGLGGHI
jgi:hypothetical protein